MGAGARRALASMLALAERMIPTSAAIDAFLAQQSPDLVLVTPLIELGSQQVDYVKSARRLGVRSALLRGELGQPDQQGPDPRRCPTT